MPLETVLALAVLALVIDALTGEPAWLYRRVPHPVVLLGRGITGLEGWLWRPDQPPAQRRRRGVLLVVAALLPALLLGAALGLVATAGPLGLVVTALACSTLVAQRSLVDHVRDVAKGLAQGLDAGRAAVARIVGRDPNQLDPSGVARAAIESAAENEADGVIAPLFWLLLLGPLGLLAYKTVNTLDSMVGYRSERYLHFGWASARLDDLINHLPARLTGLGLLLVAGRPALWLKVRQEAPKHRSPNAGWPEAAMALLLDVKLAGPRLYASGRVDDDWIGTGSKDAGPADIERAIALLWRLWFGLVGLLALIWCGIVIWPSSTPA
ncbi:MAG: cobalamin biosynthesis protein CobD [Geminicoccaceae bacterium]|nr:MAG: cobalamin biosynthesis protein CobD [Geminicoccaceae bacterium]